MGAVNRSETSQAQLAAWESATVAPVLPVDEPRHTTHAYFNCCPESPDGRWLLFFSSITRDGECGDIRIVSRIDGEERVLARGVQTEDAHRAACQQWSDGGACVVFHDRRYGRWVVCCVDVETGREHLLAWDRQLGFGACLDDVVPVYGCHWSPGEYRDLEMIDIRSGALRQRLEVARVIDAYAAWIEATFEDRQLSVFFPVVSPDGGRVMFKLARGRGGSDHTGLDASHRAGKIVYDLRCERFICQLDEWGHPSWASDGHAILEKGNVLFDCRSAASLDFAAGEGPTPSDHPSLSPDGALFVTDGRVFDAAGVKGPDKGIFVAEASVQGQPYLTLTTFADDGGASSWRPVHPHPVFSHDGRRIYFNRNIGDFSRLFVASCC